MGNGANRALRSDWSHLARQITYTGWSEGKLNLTFMEVTKAFFLECGHEVAETFVERGYQPEEEVKKHTAADIIILQTPVNWFSAPWIYKKYVDEVFNVGLASKTLLKAMAERAKIRANSTARAEKCRGKFMISATWNAPKETFDNTDSVIFGGKGRGDLFLTRLSDERLMSTDE